MTMKHSDKFIKFSNMLELKVSHAVYGYHRAYSGSNRIHFNRIFMICEDTPHNGGMVNHQDKAHLASEVKLHPGRIIFIPRDIDLEFTFTQNLHIIAFHFTLEIFPGCDVFSGIEQCRFIDNQQTIIKETLVLLEQETGLRKTINLQRKIIESAMLFYQNETDIPKAFLLKQRYSELMDYINRNLNAGLTVAELADVFKINRDVLSKRFSADFGISLKQFISRQLASAAADMLIETSDSISEIAEKLGFNDQYYFSRFFSKHKGMPPLKFRKNIHKMLKS